MATVMTYSPSEVTVLIEGYTIPGMLSVEVKWDQPFFKSIRGIRGQITRVRNVNLSAEMTLTLQQTSLGNSTLQSIVQADVVNGNGVFFLVLKDLGGNFQINSKKAFINGVSDIKFSNGFEDRAWSITLTEVYLSDTSDNSFSMQSIFDKGSELYDSALGQATEYVGQAKEFATGAVGSASDAASGFFS